MARIKTTTYMRQGKEVTRRALNSTRKAKRKQALARSGDINPSTEITQPMKSGVRTARIKRSQVLPNVQLALSVLEECHDMLLTGMRDGSIKKVDPIHTKMLSAMHLLTQSA